MAYSKTTWQNNVTDIDENNLNKIEQGIYDNSLVVDAVTNTLNPTDTETYKTAELTEGQITDVIGVSDILIKGDTEQDGTPTPSSPVDVNVVSGSNVVNTGNENLFPLILNIDGTQILQQRCNVIIQKDEFIFTATGTDMYFGNVATANSAYQKLQGKLIKIPANAQNIYLKVSNNAFSNNFICFFDENKVSLGYSNISTSKEVPNTAKYFTLRIGVSNSVSGTTYKTKVMVSTMNKAYIPHQGKELPLDLPVENLLDGVFRQGTHISSVTLNRIINNNVMNSTNGKAYTLSTNLPSTFKWKITNNDKQEIADDVRTINDTAYSSTSSVTVNCTENGYLRVLIAKTDNGNITPNDVAGYKFQVEESSSANAYAPYGTDPIELCKIENYQDYFYRSGSKWYLHKEVGKVVLDGTQTIKTFDTQSTNTSRAYYENIINAKSNNINVYANQLSGKFIWDTDENGIYVNSTIVVFRMSKNIIGTTIEEANTYLSNNNIILYYVLATATDTEITDTTLISQLEAIYNAPLYEQTNITQENNDLPMVLDITACKDNINGIKAFIRK